MNETLLDLIEAEIEIEAEKSCNQFLNSGKGKDEEEVLPPDVMIKAKKKEMMKEIAKSIARMCDPRYR